VIRADPLTSGPAGQMLKGLTEDRNGFFDSYLSGPKS